jgi:16S rRNA (adenine1518-N6/adenine1519-N6)-dimethyltransferase
VAPERILGPAEVRRLAAALNLRPTKSRGQNFVIDPNTVRMIASRAELDADDVVLEVGPGLGSLTLALLPLVASVTAVEIEPALARALPDTVATYAPDRADRLRVVEADALTLRELPGPAPTALVANLPYNVAVPVLLEALATWPSIGHGLVMVQKEVADRLCAAPGSRTYGVPSVKLAWYADARPAGVVSASVFWPAPRVASGLVRFVRHSASPPSPTDACACDAEALRLAAFAAIDAAFAQRRKVLRTSLSSWAGGVVEAERLLGECGIQPTARGETLAASDFRCLADKHCTPLSP